MLKAGATSTNTQMAGLLGLMSEGHLEQSGYFSYAPNFCVDARSTQTGGEHGWKSQWKRSSSGQGSGLQSVTVRDG